MSNSGLGPAAGLVVLAALALFAAPSKGSAEGEDWSAKAKAAWHDTCKKCHTVPDASYETGRAFLAQITETS